MFAALALEIEPMFSVEAKKRMLSGVKDPVANLPQGKPKAKASDQAADVCGVSPNGLQTVCPPY